MYFNTIFCICSIKPLQKYQLCIHKFICCSNIYLLIIYWSYEAICIYI